MNREVAERYRKSAHEHYQYIWARLVGDMAAQRELSLLYQQLDAAIARAVYAGEEAGEMERKLVALHPELAEAPFAADLPGYMYVKIGKSMAICLAAEVKGEVQYDEWKAWGFVQEFVVPEKKTVCGEKTSHPYSSRGAPKVNEVCPKCAEILKSQGLLVIQQPQSKEATQ